MITESNVIFYIIYLDRKMIHISYSSNPERMDTYNHLQDLFLSFCTPHIQIVLLILFFSYSNHKLYGNTCTFEAMK